MFISTYDFIINKYGTCVQFFESHLNHLVIQPITTSKLDLIVNSLKKNTIKAAGEIITNYDKR